MLNCLYHPTEQLRVVDDSEREKLLATGAWFDTPTEAKNMRKDYERRILDGEQPRKRTRKLKAKDDGIGSFEQQRVCEESRSDGCIDGR